ncbi:hypothetical protein RBSWK_01513 [Rhodopirellula baltica SWK14]|uniref:Uncharacterized protein n=2 Tax=Rhodopirellula baltica TaxID=265606 RepID=L7CKL8_RHOBT|nr:hypothetical protein RBSWK_01513 [Rhodopirellula baltica SWK14]
MNRRSSGLSSLRNDDNQPSRPEPGRAAKQGVVEQMSYREPRFNWFHPLQSLKQRERVYRHQADLTDQFLDQDREAHQDRLEQNEAADRHLHRLDLFRDRIGAEDDLAEALVQSQTRLTAVAQHHQRLTAINTDNQISMIDELVKDEPTKEKIKDSLRRQAANTFIELEALAMNNDVNPGNYGVA